MTHQCAIVSHLHTMKTAKTLLLLCFLSLGLNGLHAQNGYTQSFDPIWVKTFAAYGFSWAYDMVLDADSNIYLTGYYQSSMFIDTGSVKSPRLEIKGGSGDSYFLMKFDKTGRFQWIQRSLSKARPCKVKLDYQGNILVVGTSYANDMRLTSGSADTIIMGKKSYRQAIFVAKYSPKGDVIQTKVLLGDRPQTAHDFDFDSLGNVYIGGMYEFRNKNDRALVQNSYLIIKLNPAYEVTWQAQGDTTGRSHIFAIDYDPQFGMVIGGSYEGWMRFGSDSVCTPNNEQQRFIAKFDTDLKYRWKVDRTGRPSQGSCSNIKFDNRGNIIAVYGSSYGIMNLSKFTPDGEYYWSMDSKGPYSAYPEKMIIDEKGNIYISGNSYGSTFNTAYGALGVAERAGYAPFMVKYRPDGKLLWLKTIGGDGTRYCKSMHIQGNRIYGFGWTNSPLQFQTLTVPVISGYTFWFGAFDLDEFNRYEIPVID